MNKKLKTGQQTEETKTAKCEKAVSLRHGLCFFNIKDNYPNALKCACKFFNPEAYANGITEKLSTDYWSFIFRDHYRWLFDFFDGQGIYILIDWYKFNNKYQWEFTIAQKRKNRWTVDNQKNRQIAETEAFKKAFEFLEQKIEKQKT